MDTNCRACLYYHAGSAVCVLYGIAGKYSKYWSGHSSLSRSSSSILAGHLSLLPCARTQLLLKYGCLVVIRVKQVLCRRTIACITSAGDLPQSCIMLSFSCCLSRTGLWHCSCPISHYCPCGFRWSPLSGAA